MCRTLLKYKGADLMVGVPSVAFITLTDETESRQITVVCDTFSKFQLDLRTKAEYPTDNSQISLGLDDMQFTRNMLPEVMCSIVNYMTDLQLIVVITNVNDGQYSAVIEDSRTGTTFSIRISDAILLSVANKFVPIYIETPLWERQSMPCSSESGQVAIPINALTTDLLEAALNEAIDNEQYERAQKLKEELDRRK